MLVYPRADHGYAQSFFNEENPAVDRIAKDFAQTIVSTLMEGL